MILSTHKDSVRSREWRKSHPGYDKRPFRNTEAWKRASKRYKESEKGRERNRLYLLLVRKTEPDKARSRDAVKYALKTGRLIRPKGCERCFCRGRLHAHHNDYAKYLEIIWLCPQCHAAIHHEKKRIKSHS